MKINFNVLNDYIFNYLLKYVLISTGLWPEQSRFSKRCSFVTFGIFSSSLLAALGAGLFQKQNTDPVILLETLLALFFLCIGYIKFIILYIQDNKIKKLYERIATDWKNLTDEKEFEILQSSTRQAQMMSIMHVFGGTVAFVAFAWLTYLPAILKPTTTADEYTKIFPYYLTHMIINEGMYVYQVSLHCAVGFTYVCCSYLASTFTFIIAVKHVCGLYAIVCHRLQNVIESKRVWRPHESREEKSCIELNLIDAIVKHREAIDEVDMIEQIFSKSFLVIEVAALFAIALIIFDLLCNQGNAQQLFRILLVTAVFIMYVFLINYVGEQILQVSDDIRSTAYFVDWFFMPLEARKLIHMIIRRSCKADKLTAGSIVVLSMENFAMILRVSWSTATVLFSTQRKQKL